MENDRDIVIIAIFTFITVLMWVTFELIKTVKTTTVTTTVAQIITPLNPKIDSAIFQDLESRKTF